LTKAIDMLASAIDRGGISMIAPIANARRAVFGIERRGDEVA